MCGIFCVADKRSIVSRDQLMRLTDMMIHRGPDSGNVFIDRNVGLGARRLRVHDLSPASDQPFRSACGRYAICFNGAVFNYRELRLILEKEGMRFKTQSDTEVLLNGFIRFGPKFVEKLDGMFAYVIFDLITRELFIFRDHVGIKPLHIYQGPDLFIAASEIKPILAYPGVPKKLNTRILPEFFDFQAAQPPETFFKDIEVFPAGSWMRIRAESPSERQIYSYWKVGSHFSKESTPEKLEDLLEDNLKKCWDTDRSTGLQLSGGVDSSLIAALSRDRLGMHNMVTHSVLYDDSIRKYYKPISEERYIRKVSDRFQCDARFYTFGALDVKRALPNAIWHHEAPLCGSNTSLYYLLAAKAHRDTTVFLTGEGADDIFLGYFNQWKFSDRLEDLFTSFVPLSLTERLFHLDEGNHPFRKRRQYIHSPELKDMTPIQRASAMTIQFTLHALLARHDRMFMAFGVEGRPPYCSRRIIEKRFALGDDEIHSEGMGKRVIKKMAERYFDPEFCNREKNGFLYPYGDWLADEAYWGDYWKLLDRNLIGDLMNWNEVRTYLEMPDSPAKWTGKNLNVLFSLMNFQVWYSLFFDTARNSHLIEDATALSV